MKISNISQKFYLWLGFFALLIVLRCLSVQTGYISFILITIYSLFSIENIIKSLFMSWFLVLINPALAPDLPAIALLKNFVILVCLISLIIHSPKDQFIKTTAVKLSLFFITILLLLHSVFFSQYPSISIFKIISWSLVLFICISCWELLKEESERIFFQLSNTILLLFFASIPLILVPSIGFLRNDTGFQGIFNHPQVFGPVAALLVVILFSRIAWAHKQNYLSYVLIFLLTVMVILSQARTAGLAMILACLISSLIWFFSGRKISLTKSKKFFISFGLAVTALIFSYPLIMPYILSYIFKRDEASNLINAAQASRGGLVENMLVNINSYPWGGIGFGIGSNMSTVELVKDSTFGLPLSAAIEKGVLPIAIVEELGFLLGLIVILWIIYLFVKTYKNYKIIPLFLIIILINLGEFTFFSAGGLGLIFIIFLGYCVSGRRSNFESV